MQEFPLVSQWSTWLPLCLFFQMFLKTKNLTCWKKESRVLVSYYSQITWTWFNILSHALSLTRPCSISRQDSYRYSRVNSLIAQQTCLHSSALNVRDGLIRWEQKENSDEGEPRHQTTNVTIRNSKALGRQFPSKPGTRASNDRIASVGGCDSCRFVKIYLCISQVETCRGIRVRDASSSWTTGYGTCSDLWLIWTRTNAQYVRLVLWMQVQTNLPCDLLVEVGELLMCDCYSAPCCFFRETLQCSLQPAAKCLQRHQTMSKRVTTMNYIWRQIPAQMVQ